METQNKTKFEHTIKTIQNSAIDQSFQIVDSTLNNHEKRITELEGKITLMLQLINVYEKMIEIHTNWKILSHIDIFHEQRTEIHELFNKLRNQLDQLNTQKIQLRKQILGYEV